MELRKKHSELASKKQKLENKLKLLLQQKSFEAEYDNPDQILQIDIQIAALHKQIEKTSINLLELEYQIKESDLHNNLKNSRQTISQNFNNIKSTLKKNLNFPINMNDLVPLNEAIQLNKKNFLCKSSENSPSMPSRSSINKQKHSVEGGLKILNYKIPINKIILDSEKSPNNSPSIHNPVLSSYMVKLQKLKKEESVEMESRRKQFNKEKKQLGEVMQKEIFEKKKKFLNERRKFLDSAGQWKMDSLNRSRHNSLTANLNVLKRRNRTPVIFRSSVNDY